MDLRIKTFLIIGLTLLGGIFIIILFSNTLLTQSYAQFEQDDVTQKMMKSLKMLDYENQQFIAVTTDWSRWDETYDFVRDKNDAYIERNINYESIHNIGIDFVIYLRSDNSVKYSALKNVSEESLGPLPPDAVTKILSIPGLLSFDSILDTHSGFIHLPEGDSFIVAQPVITSIYEGPSGGTLIFGEYLDDEKINTLSDISDLSLSINWQSEPVISLPASKPLTMEDGTRITVVPLSDTNITGSTLIPTIDSNGFLKLDVLIQRDIINRGKSTIFIYIVILLALGLVVILVSLVMIDRLVLSRLHTLIEQIKIRSSERKKSSESLLEGDDEFSRLAQEIHPIFLELNRSRRQLEEHVLLLTESEKKIPGTCRPPSGICV